MPNALAVIAWRSRSISRIEDEARTSPDVWKTGSLLNRRMKDDKIMVTRNDLRVITGAIYSVR